MRMKHGEGFFFFFNFLTGAMYLYKNGTVSFLFQGNKLGQAIAQ